MKEELLKILKKLFLKMSRLNVENIKLISQKKTDSISGDYNHIGFAAGFPPFLRGPYSTMYVK